MQDWAVSVATIATLLYPSDPAPHDPNSGIGQAGDGKVVGDCPAWQEPGRIDRLAFRLDVTP